MARPLTAEQHAARFALVSTARAAGADMATIAERLGIEVKTLDVWWRRATGDTFSRRASLASKRTPRPCMRCRGVFESEGNHHRLCGGCKSLSHSLSPYTPDPGGDTGRQRQARSTKA